MDCPACGIANMPASLKCDCGYDFQAVQPSAVPGWQINLAWRQKLAAYWSVSWPPWISTIVMAVLVAGPAVTRHTALAATHPFFGIQALLIPRLVRHDYRTFRVYTIRDDGRQDRTLSMREAVLVWVWMLGPQLALLLGSSLLVWWYGPKLPPQTVQSISSLALWLRFLAVGPYSIGLALRARYPGFRLQAYGFRYI
jgi:hypothetical protein